MQHLQRLPDKLHGLQTTYACVVTVFVSSDRQSVIVGCDLGITYATINNIHTLCKQTVAIA